jgi:hypothetical protein
MLPEILPEARLKICRQAAGDSVLIIENLPKRFLYRRIRKKVPIVDEATGIATENMKVTSEWVDVPLEKLRLSQDGLDFVHMEIRIPDVADIYARIMTYVESNVPRGEIIPKPIPYAAQPGHPMSPPIPLNHIPRVKIPVSSPPSAQAVEAGTPSKIQDEAKLQAARDRMAKARAARKTKVA